MGHKNAEETYDLVVKHLPVTERLRLVERIVHDLAASPATPASGTRYDWMSVAGIAPGLLAGEDAQEWVSRSRRESDEHRQSERKPDP